MPFDGTPPRRQRLRHITLPADYFNDKELASYMTTGAAKTGFRTEADAAATCRQKPCSIFGFRMARCKRCSAKARHHRNYSNWRKDIFACLAASIPISSPTAA